MNSNNYIGHKNKNFDEKSVVVNFISKKDEKIDVNLTAVSFLKKTESQKKEAEKKQNFITYLRNGGNFKKIPNDYKNDKDILIEALTNNGFNISYITDKSLIDKEMALIANKTFHSVLKYVGKNLTSDKELVQEAVKKNVGNGKYISNSLLSDYDYVYSLIKINPNILIYANENLKTNHTLIKYAVSEKILVESFDTLTKINKSFFNDIKNVEFLVKHNGKYILNCPIEYHHNKDLVKMAILNGFSDLGKLDSKLYEDKEFVLETIKLNFEIVSSLKSLSSDRDILKIVLTENPYYFYRLNYDCKNDRDLILVSVNNAGEIYRYIPRRFFDDIEIIRAALMSDSNMINYIPKEVLRKKEYLYEFHKFYCNSIELNYENELFNKYKREDALNNMIENQVEIKEVRMKRKI